MDRLGERGLSTNADPRLLTFEVTETSVISSYDAAETCLQKSAVCLA